MSQPSAPRFFVDENDLALGRCLASARRDVLHPGHKALPEVPLGTKDGVWLPIVGGKGLTVLTRDKRIRTRPAEARAIIDAGVRGFVLTRASNLNTWDTLTVLVDQWNALERFLVENPDGPWLASITRAGVEHLRFPQR